MSTVTTKPANPKVGFVSLGCPKDTENIPFHRIPACSRAEPARVDNYVNSTQYIRHNR